jgi:molybdopterin converting factor small subunit
LIRVSVPSPLFSYTGGQRQLQAHGTSLAALLAELDAAHPGMRHRIVDEQDRIRPHIRFFVNGEMAAGLDCPLNAGDDVMIVAALSGG